MELTRLFNPNFSRPMLTIKSLQQRLIIFLILPVAIFLVAIGVGGYFYIRDSLYAEWQEAAILRLERAAHYMDMRLSVPLQWMQSLANTGGDRQGTDNQKWVLQKLREQPGVSQVTLTWQKPRPGGAGMVQEGRGGGGPGPPGGQDLRHPSFFILRIMRPWSSDPPSWMGRDIPWGAWTCR